MSKLRTKTIFCLVLVGLSALAAGSVMHTVHHKEQVLRAHFDEDFDRDTRRNLLRWVRYISSGLLQVYGRWPRDEWEISVSSVAVGSGDVIPWAEVKRGEVNRVEFLVDIYAPLEKLKSHWTAYHELAHLLLPYRGYGDVWFSEGLATYYQNLLLARVGEVSEREMWQMLYDGFVLGRNSNPLPDFTLQEVAANLANNGAYMRVYWSGAWYFLVADVHLREQSGGKMTLDRVLSRLNRCCGERRMSVGEIIDEMDRELGSELFSSLYREVAASRDVPDFESVFERLGITVIDGEVSLSRDGEDAQLRRPLSKGRELWELQHASQ